MSDDVEKVAEIIYGAMMWANQRPASGQTPPPWTPGGNSDAQECARQTARAALSALGGWNEAIEAAAKAAENFKRPIPPKPTIAELERILQRADPPSVEITPDGEVRAKGTHIGHEIAASIRVLSRPSSSYANRWQPIETAPKDCDVLLGAFYDSGYWDVQLGHWQPHNKRWPPTGQNQPSHWHHIPTPPAKGE